MSGVSGHRDVAGLQLTVTPQAAWPALSVAVAPANTGGRWQVPMAVACTHALAIRV
jgi:hypothetical protein